MGIKSSAEDARFRLREAAEETVWTVEERVLWRGSDAARTAAEHGSDAARSALWHAHRAVRPLQRLIQTRIAWPLADRLEDYGHGTRTAIATAAVVAALGAGVAGAQIATNGGEPAPAGSEAMLASAEAEASVQQALSGIAPDFEQTAGAAASGEPAAPAIAADAVPPAPEAPPADAPEPAQVAWDFAQAFVRYEVGKADEETAATFAEIAEKPLAAALTEEPPRLPESAEVPKAEVLNVVLGEQEGKELEVSVSLLRLRAASELRLTLEETPKGWHVTEVRG